MTPTSLLRVFAKGGVISPADLLRTMEASSVAGNRFVMFSSRQDILFPADGAGAAAAEELLRQGELDFFRTSRDGLKDPLQPRNIVSSYASVNVMDTTWWLKEAVYQQTLANFEGPPRLKVNIVDPVQSLVPLFGGHIHFIASREEHHWHLYLRAGDLSERIERWPGLIHGDDLARVAREIEARLLIAPGTPLPRLIDDLKHDLVGVDSEAAEDDLRLPNPSFPYCEGLNSMLNNQYWLGLYWRNNRFDIDFLRAACHLCQDTKVGRISLTPWKSFIIKGIRTEDRIRWEKLMGAFGINMRHSSLELNWHIPALDDELLELKNDLVRELTFEDISTHGLTFTVKSPDPILLFTSVVIEREGGEADGVSRYSIRHAREFNPNLCEYLTYATSVTREELPARLIDLSKQYSSQLDVEGAARMARSDSAAPAWIESNHQCGNCLTIYDTDYGDHVSGIPPGVQFDELPDDYVCPICAAGKERFSALARL